MRCAGQPQVVRCGPRTPTSTCALGRAWPLVGPNWRTPPTAWRPSSTLEDGLRAGLLSLRASNTWARRASGALSWHHLAAPRRAICAATNRPRHAPPRVAGLIGTPAPHSPPGEATAVADRRQFRLRRAELPGGLATLPHRRARSRGRASCARCSTTAPPCASALEPAAPSPRFALLPPGPAAPADYVLFAFRDCSRRRYLRDLKPSEVPGEIERHYAANPAFHRTLGDFLAGMSDRYARDELARLTR